MSDIDLDKLEALAKAATPGPWFVNDETDHWKREVRHGNNHGLAWLGHSEKQAIIDAEYIAAVNTCVVLDLVKRLRYAESIGDALNWITEARFASGDNGKRMLPEFIEYLESLKSDADRAKELEQQLFDLLNAG